MSIRVLIVDDEPLARQRLRQLMAEDADLDITGECGDGLSAVEAIERLRPDLVFLDVQMPELDGFGVVEALGLARMPATLFVTAHDRYALDAFEANAIDYLLKPFDEDRFHRALGRARHWLREGVAPRMDTLMQTVRSGCQERILVRSRGRHLLLKAQDIHWIEAEDNYVRLHTGEGSYLLRETMAGILERLDPDRFKRVHRSAIVNLDHIKELQPWLHNDYQVLMSDGTRLTMTRTYRAGFMELCSRRQAG